MKKGKKMAVFVLILAMILSVLCFAACVETKDKIPCISNRVALEKFFGNKNTITITDDEEFYSETIYYKHEADFYAERKKSDGMNTEAKISKDTLPKQESGEFVIGAKKRVYVKEIYDGNEIISSRLLHLDEIKKDSYTTYGVFIGSNSESKYYLDIEMFVSYNEGNYFVTGNAYWRSQQVWGGEQHPENSADDFMGLTWGGNGELKCINRWFEGVYVDGTEINASTNISDTYAGYCWQFREKTGLFTSAMDEADCNVILAKTYQEYQNRETNAKFTYIHTYQNLTPSVSISAGAGGAAGSLNVSNAKYSWQLQIDVPGIIY